MVHATQFGGFVASLALIIGPVLLWLILLNRRDRRQDRLLGTVLDQIRSRELRGRVAVRVRSGVLWPRSVATVHVLTHSPNEVWDLMTRLAQCLSPHVRLEVTGHVDRFFLATFGIQKISGQPLPRPSQPRLATG